MTSLYRRRFGFTAALVLLVAGLTASLVSAQGPEESGEIRQGQYVPVCDQQCRGLGIEKVKAGEEHCGLIPRDRKDESLDAACALAVMHREELEAEARERALKKCGDAGGRERCSCVEELRPWQNVYSHVLSGRCWAECGWAYLISCEAEEE